MLTCLKPNAAKDGRYSVMQTCALLGIHRNTLRKYTEEGLIKCGFRRKTARKFYKGEDILQFWLSHL